MTHPLAQHRARLADAANRIAVITAALPTAWRNLHDAQPGYPTGSDGPGAGGVTDRTGNLAAANLDDGTDFADELRNAILDIDAHATPFGTDDDGFVSGGYLISVGSLHRALGVVGHSAAKCGGCRNCWTLDQWKAEEQLLRDELEAQAARITGLERWKAEALVVLGQWDEVWEALGRPGPLGSSKAVEALTEAHRLRATDPPADVHPRHPRQETP